MSEPDFPEVPSPRSIPAARLEQRQQLLERHATVSFRVRKPWWQRKITIIPVVSAVAVSVTAASWALLPDREASRPTTIGCYSAVSLQADTDVIGAGGATPDPAGSCREVWQRSGLDVGPDVSVCLTEESIIAVFPGRDACRTLGLSKFVGVAESAQRFSAFENEALTAVAADRCRPRSEIISLVREKLDAYGLHAWRIDDSGFGEPWAAGRPCASLAFDHDRLTVSIVPVPSG